MGLAIFFLDSRFAPCLFWCVLASAIPGILFYSSHVLLQLLHGWWVSGRCYLWAGAGSWGETAAKQELFNPAASHSFRDGSHVEGTPWSSSLGQIWSCAGGRLRAAGAHHLACRQCLTASPGMSFAASAASAALSSGSSFPPRLSGMPGSFVMCNLNLVSLSSARISFSPGHLNGVQSN